MMTCSPGLVQRASLKSLGLNCADLLRTRLQFQMPCRCARTCPSPRSCTHPGTSPGACKGAYPGGCPGAQAVQGQCPAGEPSGGLPGGPGSYSKSGSSPFSRIWSRPGRTCSCSERCQGSGLTVCAAVVRPLFISPQRETRQSDWLAKPAKIARAIGCLTDMHDNSLAKVVYQHPDASFLTQAPATPSSYASDSALAEAAIAASLAPPPVPQPAAAPTPAPVPAPSRGKRVSQQLSFYVRIAAEVSHVTYLGALLENSIRLLLGLYS